MRYLLILSFFVSIRCFSQTYTEEQAFIERKLPAFIPPSPTAASISKLAEIEVNNYSGLANISIPLYTVQLKKMTVPIFISYNSGGVKVEEIASSLGTNWSLNAGGVVTRMVKGMPDDSPLGYLSQISIGSLGIMKVGEYVNLYVQDQLSQADKTEFEREAAGGGFDTEPDIYTYSYPGHSGKFFIAPSGRIIPIPYEPINISGDFTSGFTFIDTEGNKYEFKMPETTFSYTNVTNGETNTISNNINPENTISSWYLSKITSVNNEQVVLDYITSTINPTYNSYQARYFLAEPTIPTVLCPSSSPFILQYTVTTKSIQQIQQVKLSKISFKGNNIEFNYTHVRQDLGGDNALTEVKISNDHNLLKRFTFLYEYYSNRLFLNEVQESNGSVNIPPYVIEYYNAGNLPPRSSLSQDYWGYYNGASNASLIPKALKDPQFEYLATLPLVLGDADREPDQDKMKYGIISKITYPTGGHSVFDFESNTYSKIGENDYTETIYTTITNQTASAIGDETGTAVYSPPFDITYQQEASINYDLFGNQTSVRLVKVSTDGETTIYFRNGNNTNTISGTDNIVLNTGTYKLRAFNYETEFHASINIQYKTRSNPQIIHEKMGGGLRVKKILDYDNITDKFKTRKFIYKQNLSDANTCGVLLNKPFFDYYQRQIRVQICPDSDEEQSHSVEIGGNYYVKLSAPSISLATTNGSFVGYKGIVVLNDETGQDGYSKFEYRAPDEFPDQEFFGFPFSANNSKDIKRGQLKKQKVLDKIENVLSESAVNYINENYVPVYGTDWLAAGANVGYLESHPLSSELNLYASQKYYIFSEYVKPALETMTTKDSYNNLSTTQRTNYYDNTNHLFPTRQEMINSKGEKEVTYTLFPQDYQPDNSFVSKMVEKNILAGPIEVVKTKEINGAVKIKSATLIEYNVDAPYIPQKIFGIESKSLLNLGDFKFSNKPTGVLPNLSSSYAPYTKDQNYTQLLSVNNFDAAGNVLEQQRTNDLKQSYIWGYNNTYPIAEVVNASVKDIFHTSFEDIEGNSTVGDSKTGKKSRTGGYSKSLSNLTNGSYILSYWQKSGGTWSLQTSTVTVSTNTYPINLSGQVDEVRFYPSTAQMTTYTYEPLIGMTSQCDVNNRITYYEYDGFGRLKLLKDQNGNIIKTMDYKYKTN